ncbi:MAG TPA: GreA/GreB family elongation factor [Gaiellaceae bacterium]|nr:GreA/GreB family elongation factor [Gaiellaceae bacterium]
MTETLLTAEGFEKLQTERARLLDERESLVGRLRAALDSGGPFPENGEYLDVRHELEFLDGRLLRLEDRLLGDIVDARKDGAVDLGERVTVVDLESGDTHDFRLVGSGESDPVVGAVSYASPIGAALLGRRVGDVVDVAAPGGSRRFEVVELDG